MTTRNERRVIWLAAVLVLQACATQPVSPPPAGPDLGARWVRDAAEYEALAMQAYAGAAEDLQRLIEDSAWSALPGEAEAAASQPGRKPAIIFDVDETVLNNVQFQLEHEPPFTDEKFDAWHAANESPAVPGAVDFVRRARAAGVELFFVTNRRCAPMADLPGPCPQEGITLEDLRDAGISSDEAHVMLVGEQPDWTSEKQVRRDLIGRTHRVIMLFGDDLGDFLPCVRARIYSPCTAAATRASRNAALRQHAAYWGDGWYVLPNPMYGSWTAVP